MLEIINCRQCGKEFDAILENCPHCQSISQLDAVGPNIHSLGVVSKNNSDKDCAPNAFITISEKFVKVSDKIAENHRLFGVFGGLYLFRLALIFAPLSGILYTFFETSAVLNRSTFWFAYCTGFDLLFLLWGNWLAKRIKKFDEKTISLVQKYLIALCISGAFTMYLGYKINPILVSTSSSIVLVYSVKNILFSTVSLIYFNVSERVRITFFHLLKLDDPFLEECGIDVSTLPREDTWIAYAEDYAQLAKNTNLTDLRRWVSNTDRGAPETPAKGKSIGDVDVEKFSLRIAALKNALNNDLITLEEYENKKKQILDEL